MSSELLSTTGNESISISTAESYPFEKLTFEELQAIYETAKEIKQKKWKYGYCKEIAANIMSMSKY